jgi:hypothetical protein
MNWARAATVEESTRLDTHENERIVRLAQGFRDQNFDMAEYLGLNKNDLSDTEKVRQAVREKRTVINEMDPSEQGIENQRLTEVSSVLLTDGAREIYLQEKTFGFFQSSGFYGGYGFDFTYMPTPPTEKQKDFFKRVSDARCDQPGIINDLIREWESSAFNLKGYRACAQAEYNDELVQTRKVGEMICLLTSKLCSAGITNGFHDDPRTINYNAVEARLCFFEKLFRSKLTDDDERVTRNGMACRQFRQHADTMVQTIIDAHKPGLMPPPEIEGLDANPIPNPCDKVGRFIVFKKISELCGWAGAQSTDVLFNALRRDYQKTFMCSREEEFAVISQYFIRSY